MAPAISVTLSADVFVAMMLSGASNASASLDTATLTFVDSLTVSMTSLVERESIAVDTS